MARRRNPLVYPSKPNQRQWRSPTFNFHLYTRPWQVQPFFIAPVLPGEKMTNALWKSRVVSDPVKSRLLGWHKEYFLFYVRFRDLVSGDAFKDLFTNPNATLAAYHSPANAKYFHKYGVNFAKLATDKIVAHYFRAEDETIDDPTFGIIPNTSMVPLLDGLHPVSIGTDNWLDSAVLAADLAPAEDIELDQDGDGTITMGEFEKAARLYEQLQAGLLTDMDYTDYLRTYGISVRPEEQERKPRLLRHIRQWQMPANTIEPSNGSATTAMSWQIDMRADEDRQFREPGFVIGLTLARPKTYLGNQDGSVSSLMDTALEWLPAIMRDDPNSSLVQVAPAQGPLSNQTGDYVFDLRDYFLYGEQFSNYELGAAANAVALPSPTLQKRYPTLADARAIFKDDAQAGTAQGIEEDGRIDLRIATSVTDMTPSVSRLAV